MFLVFEKKLIKTFHKILIIKEIDVLRKFRDLHVFYIFIIGMCACTQTVYDSNQVNDTE